MGFPWRKFLNIGTDIAAATVPGGTLLDGVVDRLIEVKGKTQADTEHIEYVLAQIAKAKAVYATKKPKGVFESKRMRVAILNALSVGLCFWGFPPEVADQIAVYITVPLVGWILGDTVRPSTH